METTIETENTTESTKAVRGGTGSRLARLAAGVAAFTAIAILAPIAPADAFVKRSSGGYGETWLSPNQYSHELTIQSHVFKDNGGPQGVGAEPWLYQCYNSACTTGRWIAQGWKGCLTLVGVSSTFTSTNGSFCKFQWGPGRLVSGWYYVMVDYGWHTTAGWFHSWERIGYVRV